MANRPLQLLSTRQERLDNKKRKHIQDTAGPAWFNMPVSVSTPELDKDVRVLQMRSALDPKQHYRKGEKILRGKYYQVGTVINDSTGHYTDRLTKKQRGGTILDTLIKDTERQQYFKKKYSQLQEASIKAGRAPYIKKRRQVLKKGK